MMMRTTTALLGLVGALTSAWAAAERVEPEPSRWTYWVDMGPNLAGDTAFEASVARQGRFEIEFDLGVRLDAGIGYRPTPWLTVGLESGYVWNGMRSLLGFEDLDGSLSQVPILAVASAEQRVWGPLTVRGGVGAGGIYARTQAGSTLWWKDVRGDNLVAGFQGFGGLTYPLTPKIHLGLLYRYAWTDQLELEIRFDPIGHEKARTGSVENHAITVFFQKSF